MGMDGRGDRCDGKQAKKRKTAPSKKDGREIRSFFVFVSVCYNKRFKKKLMDDRIVSVYEKDLWYPRTNPENLFSFYYIDN